MIRKKQVANKQQIISEYLTGDQTFEALSAKYGVKPRTIQTWVRAFRLKHPQVADSLKSESQNSLKVLKKQLEQAQLKTVILDEILRLSEEHTGIDLRKKFGARQS